MENLLVYRARFGRGEPLIASDRPVTTTDATAATPMP
jgi:hypothetical protein